MYPRNAASPEPIAIGPVVQISDGAVQTAGVTVRVKPVGVSEADGGGTTAYSTDGVVLYTPTQAETNYTSFVLIAKKTGCIPVSVTVVTSARSTSGEVQVGGYASGQVPLQPTVAGRTLDVSAGGEAGIDLANVGSPTTTLNLSGTTISTSQQVASVTGAVGSVTGNVGGNVVGSVGSISGVTFPSNFASMSIDGSGRVLLQPTQTGVTIPTVTSVGSVSGNVGGVSGVTFPANFGALGIDGTGAILSVVSVDELGPSALSANSLEDQIALAVWSLDSGAVYVDGSFGDRILISNNNNRAVAVSGTGNGHIAAVLHDAEPNSIPEDAFLSGAISARVIATDAIDADALADGAITAGAFAADSITATALATSAVNEIKDAVAAITPIADLATMITNDGTANARYTVSALQNGPSGEGGSVINVYPVSASTPERVAGTTITFYRDENRSVSVVTDFTLTSLTLRFVVEDLDGNDIEVIEDGSIGRSAQTFTVTIGTDVTATLANYRWALRDVTNGSDSVIARGVLSVQEAASNA